MTRTVRASARAARGGRLPDFVLLGAPKAGTTALHAALAGHPELFLSTPKEPKRSSERKPTNCTWRPPIESPAIARPRGSPPQAAP